MSISSQCQSTTNHSSRMLYGAHAGVSYTMPGPTQGLQLVTLL